MHLQPGFLSANPRPAPNQSTASCWVANNAAASGQSMEGDRTEGTARSMHAAAVCGSSSGTKCVQLLRKPLQPTQTSACPPTVSLRVSP